MIREALNLLNINCIKRVALVTQHLDVSESYYVFYAYFTQPLFTSYMANIYIVMLKGSFAYNVIFHTLYELIIHGMPK